MEFVGGLAIGLVVGLVAGAFIGAIFAIELIEKSI